MTGSKSIKTLWTSFVEVSWQPSHGTIPPLKLRGLRSLVCRLATRSTYMVPRCPIQGWVYRSEVLLRRPLVISTRSGHESHYPVQLSLAWRFWYRNRASTVRYQSRKESGGSSDTIHTAQVQRATSIIHGYRGVLPDFVGQFLMA